MAHNHEMKLFAGSSHPELARDVADLLGQPILPFETRKFPDGELHVRVGEVVRNAHVFFFQTGAAPVNDHLIETFLAVDAFRRAGAARISVVMAYYPYSRQERMSKGRESISARVIADCLENQGMTHLIFFDIHAPAIQGFFHVPVDPLSALPILAEYFRAPEFEDCVVISPDVGRAKLAGRFAELTGHPLAVIHKRREGKNVKATHLVGDVRGKRPLFLDDMIAGGSILGEVDEVCRVYGAAGNACLAITHPILLPKAVRMLEANANISKLVVTNTLPVGAEKRTPKVEVLSIAPLLARIIRKVHLDLSISEDLVLC
jgi:ribose-phosphate pyrophosphokinase